MRNVLLLIFLTLLSPALGALEPGEFPPDFRLPDTRGVLVETAAMRGQLVVVEWWNPDCPPDMAYYDPPYQQKLQEEYTAKGVIWLLISSSAHGIGGVMSPQRANQWVHNHKAHPSHVVIDKGQKLAAQYGATATPTVFLLGRNGKLIYKGAIDDGEKKEYLREALDEALAGKAITLPKTRSWGCGIR